MPESSAKKRLGMSLKSMCDWLSDEGYMVRWVGRGGVFINSRNDPGEEAVCESTGVEPD